MVSEEELDNYMIDLGFEKIEVPIYRGNKKMVRYHISKVPYSTVISRWKLRMIINHFSGKGDSK